MSKSAHRTTNSVKSLSLFLSLLGDIGDVQGKRYRLTIPMNALVFDHHSPSVPAYFYTAAVQLGNAAVPCPDGLAMAAGNHLWVGDDGEDVRQSVISAIVVELTIASDAAEFSDIPLIVKGFNAASDAPATFTLPDFEATADPPFGIADIDGGAIPSGFGFVEVVSEGGESVSEAEFQADILNSILTDADGNVLTDGDGKVMYSPI